MSENLKNIDNLPAKSTEELEREDWLRRYRESRSLELAREFHNNWRKGRLRDDGTYEPRVKQTEDKAWITAHGTDSVDIANTDFSELPADWQEENMAAARVIYDLIDDFRTRDTVIAADRDPSPAGELVHGAWLERNQWATGTELDHPFSQLPTEEQAKDIEQVEIGRQEFGYAERRAA